MKGSIHLECWLGNGIRALGAGIYRELNNTKWEWKLEFKQNKL